MNSFVIQLSIEVSHRNKLENELQLVAVCLINHLMYADDLVLISPSAMGLSLLLSVCSAYGIEHDIKYKQCQKQCYDILL